VGRPDRERALQKNKREPPDQRGRKQRSLRQERCAGRSCIKGSLFLHGGQCTPPGECVASKSSFYTQIPL
jgi:hypothetical protein